MVSAKVAISACNAKAPRPAPIPSSADVGLSRSTPMIGRRFFSDAAAVMTSCSNRGDSVTLSGT